MNEATNTIGLTYRDLSKLGPCEGAKTRVAGLFGGARARASQIALCFCLIGFLLSMAFASWLDADTPHLAPLAPAAGLP